MPLSALSLVFVGGVVLALFLSMLHNSAFGLLFLLLLPPLGVLYVLYWRTLRDKLDVDVVCRMFAAGFLPGAVLAAVAEGVLSVAAAAILYGGSAPDLTNPSELKGGSVRFVAFLAITAYITAGCVEEGTKLIMSRARCCGSPCNSCHPPPLAFVPDVGATAEERSLAAKITLVLIVAASLGFSTIETIGYTAQAGVTSGATSLLVTAVLRTVVSLPLHTICGMYTAAMLIRNRGLSENALCSRFQLWLGSLWPAVLIHGTFDFALFIAISVDSNPVAASVGVLAFNISLLVASVLVWRRLWRNVLGSIGVSPTPAISPRSLGDAAAILAAAAARRDPGASPPTPPPSLQRGPWRASPQPAPSPMRSPGRVALARAALALSPVSAARASGSASTAAAAAHHAFGGASGARAMASPSRIVDVEVGRSDGVTPDAHDDDGGGGDDEREMLLGGDDTGRRATAPKTAAAAGDEL